MIIVSAFNAILVLHNILPGTNDSNRKTLKNELSHVTDTCLSAGIRGHESLKNLVHQGIFDLLSTTISLKVFYDEAKN